MRPLRPIPPPAPQTSLRKKDADAKKKPKRRFKQALSRARRRTINPLRWGSQHLKGAFLDSRNVIIVERENRAHPVEKESETEEDSDTDSEGDRQDAPITVEDHFEPTPTPKAAIAKAKPAVPVRGPSPPIAEENNLAREKMQSLIVLDSMFAGLEEDQEWGGKESVDSDVDMGDVQPSQEEAEIAVDSTPSPIPATPPPPPTTSAQSKLKALFAPQEEQGIHSMKYKQTSTNIPPKGSLSLAISISTSSWKKNCHHSPQLPKQDLPSSLLPSQQLLHTTTFKSPSTPSSPFSSLCQKNRV